MVHLPLWINRFLGNWVMTTLTPRATTWPQKIVGRGNRTSRSSKAKYFMHCTEWRAWLTALMAVAYASFVLLWTAFLSWMFWSGNTGPFSASYFSSFALMLTVGMTLLTARQHWINYTQPDIQRYIVQLAIYMPVFSLFSVSLWR